jgi:pyruvate dehydrogenase E2 component (dihydrolipoyllysine-residue acetyltransferase)
VKKRIIMATEITMPKLSDTMTEGRLVAWKKNVGDRVERGEIIAEVETDKATMELEAFTSGALLEIRVKPGEMAPVGTVMALVGEAGEAVAAAPSTVVTPAQPAAPEPVPSAPVPEAEAAQVKKPEVPVAPAGGEEKASPLVRRLAREKGIDLGQVAGSGPEGRILQEDLGKAGNREPGIGTRDAGPGIGGNLQTVSAAETTAAGGGDVQPLSRMRGAVARAVSEAWRTIPHFYVTVDVDMGEAERVRKELKDAGTNVSLNDFIVRAAAIAIASFPLVNGSFGADGIAVHPDINIGIAVALDDGLIVPVVKGCQSLALREIAVRSRELIARARAGTLIEPEISGGTFSVSNLGMYGTEEFAAIIHPSQGAILALGAVTDRPVIREGHLAAARMMRATLSADHRLIDGAYAAKFLRELKRVLENPVSMLV